MKHHLLETLKFQLCSPCRLRDAEENLLPCSALLGETLGFALSAPSTAPPYLVGPLVRLQQLAVEWSFVLHRIQA